jgi:hypothetical protein
MRNALAGFGMVVAVAACGQSSDSAATSAVRATAPTSSGPGANAPAMATKRTPHADAATLDHVRAELAQLTPCRSELECPAFDALLDLGDVAAPEVLAYVADHSHGDSRRLAARVLGRLHYAPAGPQLVAIGNGEPDVMAQMDLLKAAGQCGGNATFDALALEYDREQPGAPGEHLAALRDGLRAFHDRALPWALAATQRGGETADKYADVLCEVAKPVDRDLLVSMVGKTQRFRVDDRLAARALVMGATDQRLYDTLLAGLISETPEERSDAATMLRVVAPRFPEVQKAKAAELIRKAMPKADPELAGNLKASLAVL